MPGKSSTTVLIEYCPHCRDFSKYWKIIATNHYSLVELEESGVSPDEKIFTPTDERGFLPYTPHPTPSFKSGGQFFSKEVTPNLSLLKINHPQKPSA
ncbi:hypothetical protein [Microcystis sp. LEGE 08355]|jgi:hypothetical protein|uniref:hypothetical protein n=1 Tax=Microcystis sp. LEGE 08355 TaxID=1828687 RepID=UPI0018818591|nr:hypothetical protein [Microcystis sp. LEGE 08355]MBE9071897.1 hypothetical protein [Microcystis sp. LEGE 08355]